MGDAIGIHRDIRGRSRSRAVDAVIAALAARQHGVVARRQLRALGLSVDAIDRRVGAGRLHVVHRGVYAVGHRALSRHGHWMAAVLAGGDDAALSHRSAAELWGIRATARREIEITVARECDRPRAGHPTAHPRRPHPAHHHTKRARTPLPHPPRCQSLPRPLVNAATPQPSTTSRPELDFTWRAQRLIVEVDGYETHGTRAAFERDRARDRALQVRGRRVVRITWRQLEAEQKQIAAELRALLAA